MSSDKEEKEKGKTDMQPVWMERLRQKKWKKSDFVVLALVGVLLLVVAFPTEGKMDDSGQQDRSGEEDEEEYRDVERELERILSKIEGAGEVEVMITYEDQGTSVVEKDQSVTSEESTEVSSDSTGSTKKQTQRQEETVYDGEDQPYVVKELEPAIEGILVVAEGGDDVMVQKNISDAVMALFDVELHKIKIVKMN